jgi:hypothetical protein
VWSILGASVILGLCAAVLWTAQGAFITANTTAANRGAYSGIFWCVGEEKKKAWWRCCTTVCAL